MLTFVRSPATSGTRKVNPTFKFFSLFFSFLFSEDQDLKTLIVFSKRLVVVMAHYAFGKSG